MTIGARVFLNLVLALLAVQGTAFAQTIGRVTITAPFRWPRSEESISAASRLSKGTIESFVNAARAQIPETKGLPIHVAEFRFVPLERGKLYLVALTGTRFFWSTDVIAPEEGGFRYTALESDGGIPFAMQAVDLTGDGVDELVTGSWPAGYQGALTPDIYWYTVWQFQNGIPKDVSARFPEFYRSFVLGQLSYPETLLESLKAQDPEGTRIPLAEIEYVRLKFERPYWGTRMQGWKKRSPGRGLRNQALRTWAFCRWRRCLHPLRARL